jgi:hypothetical protein
MPPTPRRLAAQAEQVIDQASDLPQGAEVQVVLFGGESAAELEAYRLNPTDDLSNRFRGVAERFAQLVGQRTIVAYGPGRVPAEYEVALLPAGDVRGLTELLETVEAPVDLELFAPEFAQGRNLRFYDVAVRLPDPGWVHFLRAKGASLRLRRTSKIAAVMRGATYDELEDDPLLFDENFDAIVAGGLALIVNQGSFQRALGFVEQARALAAETVDALGEELRISNWDEFRAAATADINMISKIRSIAAKIEANPAYAAAMTTERVIAFAEANGIEIDTERVDGERQLVFHSEPARRWRILKLLDDDYLHSQLTEFDYEVNSKSPREG